MRTERVMMKVFQHADLLQKMHFFRLKLSWLISNLHSGVLGFWGFGVLGRSRR